MASDSGYSVTASGNKSPRSYEAKDTGDLSEEEQVLATARERFRQVNDYNSEIRAKAVEDLQFFLGNQWNSLILRERTEDRRPALTINKLPTYVQQVVNDIRQNRPQIKIRPVDSVTDPKTADVINGMVRHITSNSDYKAAIDTALEYAAICGQGYFRLYNDYTDPLSMDQEIIVERIDNPMSVYFPVPLCKNADYSDAPYCFIRTMMSKDEFKRKYGEKVLTETQSWQGKGIGDTNWTTETSVWLAEYFEVVEKEETLYQLLDGSCTIEKPEDQSWIVKERKTCTKKIMWRLMSEGTILEEEEFPGAFIPVIPVLGWEINIDGKKDYMSLIRHAKDPQRLYNYFKSMEAEVISLAPKAPWLVAVGQIENHEDNWKVSNTKNLAYLEYNPIAANGSPVPPPQRIDPPQIPTAAVNAMREASDDIKATTGIYDASLGAQGNESSGRAIIARQRQGDTATFHFVDNLTRAVRHMGRIMVDIIPKIYDTPRIVRILGEDMSDEIVLVNQMHRDEKTGDDRLYDLTVGKYDVTVDVGPSYESRRIETAENLTNIIKSVPQIGAVCSDILVRNLDFPGASELSDRLKRTIPPNILVDPNENPNKVSEQEIQMIVQDLQNLQGQLQQAGQEKQQLVQMLQHYQGLLDDKSQEQQLKADAAVLKAHTEMSKARMGLQKTAMQHDHENIHHAVDTAVDLHKASILRSEPEGRGVPGYGWGTMPNPAAQPAEKQME
jgi:hypothetical protein